MQKARSDFKAQHQSQQCKREQKTPQRITKQKKSFIYIGLRAPTNPHLASKATHTQAMQTAPHFCKMHSEYLAKRTNIFSTTEKRDIVNST
ncbi:MAG: hypothetical protein HON55_04255 [Legionellales bacterium]|jgi:hypothetical protein|nr:hypothetical protein [Legionellales bacterium]